MFRDREEAGGQTFIVEEGIDPLYVDAERHVDGEGEDGPGAGVGKVKVQGVLRVAQRRFAVAAIGKPKRRRITLPISAENLAQPTAPDDKRSCFLGIKESFSALYFVGGEEALQDGELCHGRGQGKTPKVDFATG
jgi:hypothetical protein